MLGGHLRTHVCMRAFRQRGLRLYGISWAGNCKALPEEPGLARAALCCVLCSGLACATPTQLVFILFPLALAVFPHPD